ncbi:hypothetical protein [Microbulbifer sp. ZKSA002]|uniref:hypothetical protein n=1 Tax=Microbulbifer sp. ZKSA002 TaxID=3243388 RepID=UPI0040394E5C
MKSEMPSREMGRQEALFVELSRQSKGGLQLISFIRVCEPLAIDTLRSGLKILHQYHPLLRARVEKDNKYRWVCDVDFSEIPIDVYRLDEEMDFEREYSNQAKKYIDSDRYAYCLSIFCNHEGLVQWVIVNNIHAIMDGRSIMTLFLQLDQLVQKNKLFRDNETLPLGESIAKNLEVAGYVGEKHIFHDADDQKLNWPVEKVAPASKRQAGAIARLLCPEDLHQLAKIGKDRGVKLTAILCAIASIASVVLPTYKKGEEIILALDGRGLCTPPIPLEHIGSFSQTTQLSIPEDPTSVDIIDFAENLQSQIYTVLTKQRPMAKKIVSEYTITEVENMARETILGSESFFAGVCVSNVGSLSKLGGRMKFFDIEKGMVTQTNGLNPLTVISYTTNKNSVFVFGYCEPLMSRNSVLLYIKQYMDIIGGLIH